MAVAGLVAGATVAVVVTRSAGTTGYRTAAVATQDLAQRLTTVGAVEPVDRAAVAFPVTGTVATVDVAVGDAVTTGQTLASLDPTSLDMDVRQQQAALDQAELVLQRALDGESVASPGSGGSSGAPASASQTAATTLDTDAPTAVLLAADVGPTTTSAHGLDRPDRRRAAGSPAGGPRRPAGRRRQARHRPAGARLRRAGVRSGDQPGSGLGHDDDDPGDDHSGHHHPGHRSGDDHDRAGHDGARHDHH